MRTSKITIPSSKGNLAAAIHYPDEKTDRLAILCVGYLDSKDYAHMVDLAERLVQRGYTAVRFDPTGTWESEGDIADYTITQYLEDMKNVLEHMLGQGKYSHILLGGHSRGATVSLLYAAKDPRISTVVAIMPSSPHVTEDGSREEWKEKGIRQSWRDIPGSGEKREFRVPYSYEQDRTQYRILEEMKKIHIPVLFLAGELDTLVVPARAREIFDVANEPKKFLLMKGIGHDYRHSKDEVMQVNNLILKALNEKDA